MNYFYKLLALCSICFLCLSCKPSVNLDSEQKEFSYAYGAVIGNDLKLQGVSIDLAALKQGIEDAYADKEMLMTKTELEKTYMLFQNNRYKKFKIEEQEIMKKNIEEGKKFLAENASKPGVVRYENGLQYKVITEGTGRKPNKDSIVLIHFIDKFTDGTVFYNTYQKVSPVQFQIGGNPQGWSLALPLMKEGAIWELYLPGSLAYGKKSVPGQGPYKPIISRIEFIKIVDPN